LSSLPAEAAAEPRIHIHHRPITGDLARHVRTLMAVEIDGPGPLPLSIAPHDTLMLTVQLGRSRDSLDEKGAEAGHNTRLTGIREWTGRFTGAGNCVSLFALLTPLGGVELLDSQPLQPLPRIRASVAELLDRRLTRELESDIALAQGLDAKLDAFGNWLEKRAVAQRQHSRAALRAGRAAMRLCAEPRADIETLADEQHVSRRQLEREQTVSRRAQGGAALADIAADVGFADQAHMSRVVRELTGLTPRAFVRSQRTPIAAGFRTATGGGTVYL
jgi:AraC-like DNA-binding protein